MIEYPTECVYCGKGMYISIEEDPYIICKDCKKRLKEAIKEDEQQKIQ